MRLKATFQKDELHVGLSVELPLKYRGAVEKYQLADILLEPSPVQSLFYQKETFELEFEGTTSEWLGFTSLDRINCHLLVDTLPEEALPEVVEDLKETREHYLALQRADREAKLLLKPTTVAAKVHRHLET